MPPKAPSNLNWYDMPILKSGSSELDAVKVLQLFLWWQGAVGPENPFWQSREIVRLGITGPEHPLALKTWTDGVFGSWTERALVYFQQLAVGKDKIPLDEICPVGTCDMDTWWALFNYDAVSQDQGVPAPALPQKKGLGLWVVSVWEHYLSLGVKEIPKGSNRGPKLAGLKGDGGIDVWTRYLGKAASVKGPAWCCWSRTGVEDEANECFCGERKPIVRRDGLCYANWQYAKKMGWAIPKEDVISGKVRIPVGAAFIMNNGDITGHTGTVVNTVGQGKATSIETIEGNISDAIGRRKRSLSQGTLKAFIVHPSILVGAVYELDSKGVSADNGVSADKEKTT